MGKTSFDTMRFIVTVGWSIYPLGYFFGYLMGQVRDDVLNLVYNLADFVNKIAFCLAIWQSAKNDPREDLFVVGAAPRHVLLKALCLGQVLLFSPAPLSLSSANRQHLGFFRLAEQQ